MRKAVTFSLLLVVLLGALCVVLLAAAVFTYHRLTSETLIAELTFDATGDRQYLAHLRTGDRCGERVLPVLGDQWRIDAEFVKWKYWATLIGLDAQYRLDRLEGRYRSAAEQNTAPKLAHELDPPTAIDVVGVAGALGRANFLLDATYGSSTYQDIDVGNLYRVYRTTTGIITRTEPRPPPPEPGEALPIDVRNGCAAPPSAWRRFAAWTDSNVLRLLGAVGLERS
jgi:hypothetical protein